MIGKFIWAVNYLTLQLKNREEIYAKQDELCYKQYGRLYARFNKLGAKMPQGKNAQYTEHDLLRMLQEMSKNKKFAESASEQLKRNALNKTKEGDANVSKTPSGNWTLGKIRNVNPNRVKQWCWNNNRYVAQMAKKAGLVKPGCTVAADITNIPYHDENLRDEMRTSKPKSGTSKFCAHIAIHTVTKDYNIILDARTVSKDTKIHKPMLQMMKNLDRQGLRPCTLLVDREMYAAAVIKDLKSDHRNFLMPAVKNSRIKKAIAEVDDGKRKPRPRFLSLTPRQKKRSRLIFS